MNVKNKLEICKKCNELLSEYAKTRILNEKRSIENKIEKFLKEYFIELKDFQEYKSLFLKYIYVKEGMDNNEK